MLSSIDMISYVLRTEEYQVLDAYFAFCTYAT